MSQHRIPDRFDSLNPVKAPPELRRRTMTAALDRLHSPAHPDAWTRVLRSRGLRFAWAAAIALLVLGHLALSLRPGATLPRSEVTPRIASSVDPEVRSVVRLVRIKTSPAIGGLLGSGGSPDSRRALDEETGEENGS